MEALFPPLKAGRTLPVPDAVLRVLCVLCAGLSCVAAMPDAVAQTFPNRTVRVIMPAAAGGGGDSVARAMAQALTLQLGQSVIVENRPGGALNIGAAYVAKSPPDGYTLLVASTGNAVNMSMYKSPGYDIRRDFAPISHLGTVPNVLIVNNALPTRNLAEFIALAKARPGALNHGVSGLGSSAALSGEMLKIAAKIDFKNVMYKGGAPAMTDLIGGHIELMFNNLLAAIPQIEAGKVRALAITDNQRSAMLPSVPTFGESGFPEVVGSTWWGVFAPAGTPANIVKRLNDGVVAAANGAEFRKTMETVGGRVVTGTPQELAAFVDQEVTTWANLVKTAGIVAQ